MKRGASEYITKEHGTYENRDAAADPPKMSTAAQLARRKIATPKSRTGRSTTPTAPSNPFQSQPQQSSGFQFGSNANTNASFPPQNQQSQSFQFSVPSASSSFTFGQSDNNSSQPVSNPFANVNGIGGGGFGSHQVDNTEMQDSTAMQQAQPVQPSSLFNFAASQPASSASTNGFSFGQSSQQQSNGGFGSGLFGSQNIQSQNNNTGLFGQSSEPKQNGFTPAFGQNKPPSTSSTFGQGATSSAPAFGGFGTASSASAPAQAPAPAPTFSFGQTTVTQPNHSQTNESGDKPKKLFDFGSPQPETSSTASKPSFQFGQPASVPTESKPQDTPKPAFAGFGQPAASPEPTPTPSSNLFSGFGQPSTSADSSRSQSQRTSNFFGQTTNSSEEKKTMEEPDSSEGQQTPKNPFSSLFGSGAKSDSAAEVAKSTKTPFQFGQSTSSAISTPPSAQPSEPTVQQAESHSTKSDPMEQSKAFGSAQPASPNLFSPKPSTPASSGGLFNLNKPTPSAQVNAPALSSSAEVTTPKSLFSFTPQKSAEGSSTTPKFPTFGSQPTPSSTSGEKRTGPSSDDASPPKKRLFQGTSTPAAMAQSALGSFTSHASPADAVSGERAHPQPKVSATAETSQETVTRAVSTEGPPQIPRFLSGEKYKVYDESWRLKALNRRFRDVITGLDAEKHDFMNIIQNYLDHRDAIGEGLSGYERKKSAGTKRKAIDVDDLQEDNDHGRRVKPADTSSESAANSTSMFSPPKPAASSVFSTSSTPKANTSFSPAKTVADTQTSNIFKSMIPGATNPGTATTSANSSSTVFALVKSTTPPSSPPKQAAVPQLPKFEVPKFGGGGGGDFMSAFAKNSAANAKKFEQQAKEKRKAEEFDSDEDDEEAWNKQYEEEQRAKKAKIEAAARNALAVPAFIPSASSSRSNSPFAFAYPIKSIEVSGSKSPEPTSHSGIGASKSSAIEIESGEESTSQGSGNSGDDEAEHVDEADQQEEDEQEDEEEEEEEAEEIPDIPPEDSLFSRVTGGPTQKKSDPPILQPAANNSFKPGIMFGNVGKSTPEQPTFSPFTPSSNNSLPKGDFVPTTKFNFTPAPATSSGFTFGSSMLGGALKDGPIPGEGLFGSRPSTPSNAETTKTSTGFSFGTSSTKQPADNTYKQGSPIKFGNSTSDTSAPSLEVTAATPPAKEQPKPFSSLFGQSSSSTPTNGASVGFSFGTPSTATQPAPGFLSATSHLGGVSGTSSRATSPGIMSEAESVATDNTEDYSQEPQTSLMSGNSGEENEEIIYESRAIISRMYRENEIPEKSKIVKGWNKVGSGVVKLLKDKTSSKTRILFRAEPGANVLLNTRLITGGAYKSQAAGKGGAVTFPVATDTGMQMWMIRVKSLESAQEAEKAMEANKKN